MISNQFITMHIWPALTLKPAHAVSPFPHPIPTRGRAMGYSIQNPEIVTGCDRNVTNLVTPNQLKQNRDCTLLQSDKVNGNTYARVESQCHNATLSHIINNLLLSITYHVTRKVTDVTRLKKDLAQTNMKGAENRVISKQKGTVKIKNIYGSAQRGGFLAADFQKWVNRVYRRLTQFPVSKKPSPFFQHSFSINFFKGEKSWVK